MRVAVTGGSGQLGTALLRQLARERSIQEAIVLDVQPPLVASRKVRYVEADVRDPGFERHVAGLDAVFHLAFLVTRAAPPDVFRAVNVDGSKNVFRACVAAKVPTVVYASSVAAYGVVAGHPEPIVEGTPRRPQPGLPYALAKTEVEDFLDGLEADHPDMAIARLRPGLLAGRRMDHALGRALGAGLVPDVGWPGWPIVWDDDVAQAAVLAMKRRARGAYNLVAEGALSAVELAEAGGMRRIAVPPRALLGAAWAAARLGSPLRDDTSWLALPPVVLRYDCARARDELGWRPKHPTGLDVARALGVAARGAPDPRIEVFLRLVGLTSAREAAKIPEARRVFADLHLELLGRGGGDYTLSFGGGKITVRSGAPRPPTSVLTLKASVFLDLVGGHLAMSTAELTGKVRVEGEPIGMLALGAIVNGFRAQATSSAAGALPARGLSRWIERGRGAGSGSGSGSGSGGGSGSGSGSGR